MSLTAIVSLGSLTVLTGCQDTLVFAERSGFNLGIHVNDDPIAPVQVNAGLRRSVVAFVPPVDTTDQGGTSVPRGEAVSLVSGFRLKYDDANEAGGAGLFGGDLTIRTQFASGYAARFLAGNPAAVEKVVVVGIERDAQFVERARQQQISGFLDQVDGLSADQAFSLNQNPPVQDAAVNALVNARDPNRLRFSDETAAKEILKTRIVMSGRADADLEKWAAVLRANQ